MSTFPIFSSDDEGDVRQTGELTARTPDGFRPLGQQAPSDSEFFHFRDPARAAAEQAARIDELFRQTNPALFDARETLSRCQRTKADWAHRVSELQYAVSQKAAQMAGTSAVSPLGTATERGYELVALRGQLVEAQQEYEAAQEELETARALVNSLTKETP